MFNNRIPFGNVVVIIVRPFVFVWRGGRESLRYKLNEDIYVLVMVSVLQHYTHR